MKAIKHVPLELVCWAGALAALAFSDLDQNHFSLCPLAKLGISWCPGCGLGHSISSLFHGDIQKSFQYHWLGIPAAAILLHRVCRLSVITISSYKLSLKL